MPQFDIGIAIANVLTLLGLAWTVMAGQRRNVNDRQKQHEQNTRTLQEIEGKVNLMYNWFVKHVINGHPQ